MSVSESKTFKYKKFHLGGLSYQGEFILKYLSLLEFSSNERGSN